MIEELELSVGEVGREATLEVEITMEIGERIRRARKARGIKQDVLAAHLGIGQPTLSDIERGRTASVKADLLLDIADALNVSHRWLVKGVGEMDANPQDKLLAALLTEAKDLSAERLVGLLSIIKTLK